MPKALHGVQQRKRAMARREGALARRELGYSSEERRAPVGPTSSPIKTVNAETDRMVQEFLSKKRGTN